MIMFGQVRKSYCFARMPSVEDIKDVVRDMNGIEVMP